MSTSTFVRTTDDDDARARVRRIDVRRWRLYPAVSRPGLAWQWEYGYRTDGSDWLDWGTSLVELRRVLERRYVNATVITDWDH